MEESALERYFDQFITREQEEEEEEEEREEEEQQQEQEQEEEQQEQEEEGQEEEEFFSLLPDELLTLDNNNNKNNNTTTTTTTLMLIQTSGSESSRLDYSSQNPSAGSSMSELVHRTAPVTPATLLTELRNVQSTVNLGCSLDLLLIARTAKNVEYKPKRFPGLIMRICRPRTTALIFKSGNIVCTGAKSADQSRLMARRVARIVQKLGFPARFLNFKIYNMVASCETFPVSMEQLANQQHCNYEPELFPGLFYSGVTGISVIIFPSGKIIVTGAKSEAEVFRALDTIRPILSRFKRK